MVMSLLVQISIVLFVTKYGLGQQYDSKGIKQLVHNGEELNPKINKHLIQLVISKVSFSIFGPELNEVLCSGSIISNRWILTSAHCFLPSFIMSDIVVNHKERGNFHKIAGAIDVVLRDSSFQLEDYSAENIKKDLALVYTKKRIEFNDRVHSIPLAKKSIQVGKSAIISGFGEVEPGVIGARQGVVQISKCPKRQTSILCSEGMVKSTGGDSGGSLMYKGRLVGVTSSGCSDVYSSNRCWTYYVNVAANLDWIREKTLLK